MKVNAKCISNGIGYGKLVYRYNDAIPFSKASMSLEESMTLFDSISNKIESNIKDNMDYEFLNAHALIIKDPVLRKKIEDCIKEKSCSLIYAFSKVMDEFIDKIKAVDNQYLKERYLDLLDIKRQFIREIDDREYEEIKEASILVIDELLPSDVLNLNENIKGIIAHQGGYTAHSSILCRAMHIPYVILKEIKDCDYALINKDEVYLNPTEEEMRVIHYHDEEIDYTGCDLYANLSSMYNLDKIASSNFKGIGLYRSEFLFMSHGRFLNLDEQTKIYKKILERMYPKTVIMRTFDFGDDKHIPGYQFEKGINSYFKHMDFFKTQIKAMDQANPGNLKIMFPYIKTNEEFLTLKKIVLEETKTNFPIGIMLETKEAIENINDFKDASFFSLGTNDLLKELFDVSRSVIDIEEYIEPLKEKLIPVVEFAKENKKPLCVCGEMASINKAVKDFKEIGIEKFSIN